MVLLVRFCWLVALVLGCGAVALMPHSLRHYMLPTTGSRLADFDAASIKKTGCMLTTLGDAAPHHTQ
jgi:hypothetical protein